MPRGGSNPPPPRPIRKLMNIDLPQGISRASGGHLRFTSPRELRGEYVHRWMVRKMIEETPYSIKLMLPNPYEVHHMDWRKEHNCGCNFLILSPEFHSAVTASRQKKKDKFVPRWKRATWLFWDEVESGSGEVPF